MCGWSSWIEGGVGLRQRAAVERGFCKSLFVPLKGACPGSTLAESRVEKRKTSNESQCLGGSYVSDSLLMLWIRPSRNALVLNSQRKKTERLEKSEKREAINRTESTEINKEPRSRIQGKIRSLVAVQADF